MFKSISIAPIIFSIIVPGGGYIYRSRYLAASLLWTILGGLWAYTVFTFRYDYTYQGLAFFAAEFISALFIIFTALDSALQWTARLKSGSTDFRSATIATAIFWIAVAFIIVPTKIKRHNLKVAWETNYKKTAAEKYLTIKQEKEEGTRIKEQSLSQCDKNFVKRFDSFWANQSEEFPVTKNCEIPETKGWTRHKMNIPLTGLTFSPSIPYTFTREKNSMYSDQGVRSLTFADGEIQFAIESNTTTYSRSSNIRWQLGSDPEKQNYWGFKCYNPRRIWCLSDYLLFAFQDIPGDIGSETVVFASWNYKNDKWSFFEANEETLLNYFPDWETATVASTDSAIILKSNNNMMCIRPDKKEWAPLNPLTGEAIADSQEGLAQHRPIHDRISITEAIAESSETVSQLMHFDSKTEYFFGHEFPPEELLLRNNGKPEAYYFFFRQKATLGESGATTVGYYLLRQQRPVKLITLDMRPSSFLEDAFLLRVTADNRVTIRTVDDTHGITLEHYEYKVDLNTGNVEKLGKVTKSIPHKSD